MKYEQVAKEGSQEWGMEMSGEMWEATKWGNG